MEEDDMKVTVTVRTEDASYDHDVAANLARERFETVCRVISIDLRKAGLRATFEMVVERNPS